MEYQPEYDALAFEDQCDDSLYTSILAFLSSISPLSRKAPPSAIIFLS